MFELIKAGGWLMAPILACSLAAATIIVERLLALRRARVLPAQLLATLDRWLERGAVDAREVEALPPHSPLGRIVAAGLATRGRSREILRERVEDTGRHVAHELERFLNALGTIAAISPLLGLLGTVIGMIEIFGAQAPSAGATMGGANPAQLAHGISVALYNTAFGLIVAIPSLIFWRYFRARVDSYLLTMELASERFVRHLETLRTR